MPVARKKKRPVASVISAAQRREQIQAPKAVFVAKIKNSLIWQIGVVNGACQIRCIFDLSFVRKENENNIALILRGDLRNVQRLVQEGVKKRFLILRPVPEKNVASACRVNFSM
jgi:hypothetical protein